LNIARRLRYHAAVHLAGAPVLRWRQFRDVRRHRRRYRHGDGPLAPPLMGAYRMKRLLSQQYLAGNYVNGVRKVAWFASGAPVEILQALGFFLYCPDNHAALCGARSLAVDYCETAEAEGYSQDLCSYTRTDIGAMLRGASPVGRLPRPDLIVCCNNICQTILHWYTVVADHYRVPLFVVDTPFLYGEAKPHQVDFVQRQLEELAATAERISGRRLSFRRLRQATRLGRLATELWLEILLRAKTRPSPISAFDAFISMGPIVALRGEPATVDFYRDLLAEIDRRIAGGVGAVTDERHRLLWDNLPIWYRLKWLAERLANHGANVVISNYTYGWGELAPMMDEDRPMASAARVYLHALLNRSVRTKVAVMRRMVDDFALDGVILHSDRSCKPYSIGQIDQRAHLAGDLGVPALMLESDHNDARVFAENPVATRLDAFLETLD